MRLLYLLLIVLLSFTATEDGTLAIEVQVFRDFEDEITVQLEEID